MMVKILINVTNARNIGGGLQVAYNFVCNTIKYPRDNVIWYYAVSEYLDQNYLNDEFKEATQGRYFVFPNQPDFKHSYVKVQKQLRMLEDDIQPNVIYTILGPCYNFFKSREVIRFANSWATNSNMYAWSTLCFKMKVKMYLHGFLERVLLKKAKFLMTQTETVQQGLYRVTGLPLDQIRVVHNVLPAVYLTTPNEHIVDDDYKYIEIAAVGGQMPHKNFDLIPKVIMYLRNVYGIMNPRFHVTLPENTTVWRKMYSQLREDGTEEFVQNHGKMTQKELAILYRKCSYSFLPSVLETFSASIIEAMHFGLKIVASDLPFNKEVMGNGALYYEPMNAKKAAEQLYRVITDKELQKELSSIMEERIKKYNCYEKYFNDTVDFLFEVGTGKYDK